MFEKEYFLKLSYDLKDGFRSRRLLRNLVLIFALISLSGCASISLHDHYAYTQSINLKVDALKLMDNAIEDFSKHVEEVNELLTRIEKAFEYEKVRPKNVITTKMWQKLKDPEGHLLGGFIKRWEEKEKLSNMFIEEAKKSISDAFDQIIGLESGKIKRS